MGITLLLCFAALLLVGVLVSERANRTVLSTAVPFLLGGFVLGSGVTDVLVIEPGDEIVSTLAELALFSVLLPTACAWASRTCGGRGGCRAARCCSGCR